MKSETLKSLGILTMHLKNAPSKYVLFLGAGASISSGYPSGQLLMDNLLEELYIHSEGTLSDNLSILRIWFEKEFHKNLSLSNLMEELIIRLGEESITDLIKSYFEDKTISSGYYRLATLISNDYCNVIFNMNFDHALENALIEQGIIPNVIITEKDYGTGMPEFQDKPVIFKVHGDIEKPRTLKATTKQTESLPKWLYSLLKTYLEYLPFIFVGYSAQDADILTVLNSIEEKDYKIFWISPEENPTKNIKSILSHFNSKENYLNMDFDNFFEELHKRLYKRDFKSYLKEKNFDRVLKKRHTVFVSPPNMRDVNKILETQNLLIITGEPHVGKSTLGDELVFKMYLKGYNVKEIHAEGIPISLIMKQVTSADNCIFLFNDPFGSINLTNPVFANRIYDLFHSLKDGKIIITTRKSVLEEVLRKTKFAERIPNIEKQIYEIKEYPKESLLKILENHLDYAKIPKKEEIMQDSDYITSKLLFPHNIDYFISSLPEKFEKKELVKLVEKAERIKIAKREEFKLLKDEEKLALWIISATLEIEVKEWKNLYFSLIEDIYGYKERKFSEIKKRIDNWLRYIMKESYNGSTFSVRYYHPSYFPVAFEELCQEEQILKKIYSKIIESENLKAKRYLPYTISYNLEKLPVEIINLLMKLWKDKDMFVQTFVGIGFIDKYCEFPDYLKTFFRENFLNDQYYPRDGVIAHMIDNYDKIPKILKKILVKGLDYNWKKDQFGKMKTEKSVVDSNLNLSNLDSFISDLGFEMPKSDSKYDLKFDLDDLKIENMYLATFILGPVTMNSFIKNYGNLPQDMQKRIIDFSDSNIPEIRGGLADAILTNYEILSNDLKNLIPKILKDEKIKSKIGTSIISNYKKLPRNIRKRLFIIWEKANLDEKETIISYILYHYIELPHNVKKLIENTIQEGNNRLIFCIFLDLLKSYDTLSAPKKFLLMTCVEKSKNIFLSKSEKNIYNREHFFNFDIILEIIRNWEKFPKSFHNYVINNWQELYGMELDVFFRSLFEKFNVFPTLVENILYQSLKNEKLDITISAISGAINNYNKLSFEIIQMIPSVIENIVSNDEITFMSYNKLREDILENWNELPKDIKEIVFYRKEIKYFFNLIEEITFLECMFKNYSKFPYEARKYLRDLLKNSREKVRYYIISHIFDTVSKYPYADDLFSYIGKDQEIQIYINSLIISKYQEVDNSLKQMIFNATKHKDIKIRYDLAISIIDSYEDLPNAVQDLLPEISKSLSIEDKNKILIHIKKTFKKNHPLKKIFMKQNY